MKTEISNKCKSSEKNLKQNFISQTSIKINKNIFVLKSLENVFQDIGK